jgi:DnaJ like chaperone protein
LAKSTKTKGDGLGLEFLDRLTLFDERFEYDGKSHNYSEIEHIEFTAVITKHSVNFLPTGTTYSAELFLHLAGGTRLKVEQERVFLGTNKKQRYEAVIRAASMLMSITFDQRVESYERQLEQKSFVEWGDHQLHKLGDLFYRNQFRMNIRESGVTCSLQPFSVIVSKKATGFGEWVKSLISGQVEIIDLSIDKDCFLYLMKTLFSLSWSGQPVPERRLPAKKLFNEALLILGAKLSKADGHVSSGEIALFKTYFGIDEKTFPGASKIFLDAAASSDGGTDSARQLSEMLSGKKEPLEYILVGLMQIAASDGILHKAEVEFIRRVANTFSFSTAEIDRLFLIFGKFDEKKSSTPDDPSPNKNDRALVMNLRILGLEGNLTFQQIKTAYRELARTHHPDLLRAQGVPFNNIRDAEQMLKIINGAYEWLEEHYRQSGRSTQY